MKHMLAIYLLLIGILVPAQGFALPGDPASGNQLGFRELPGPAQSDCIKWAGLRDTIPPSFSISHVANGEVTVYVTADEDLYAGWVDEKGIWSVANFDYWWLNTRLAKDQDNRIYAAVKLYEYSHPNSNFDMFVLRNSGEILEQHSDWNGPGGNPLIVNNPQPNIYIGKPVLDREGAVDSSNLTYIFSNGGGSDILFTKIDADGMVLISNQVIITGANGWTNEIRTAIDTSDRIYLVWSKDMHDITYAYSDDGGDSWSDQISICYNPSNQLNKPQVCCDGNDNVHVIWQHWTGSSNLLSYMKVRPDGSISIDESFLTQSNNQVWSAQMDIDEENNLHIVWARSSQQITNAYYTKINGNLDGGGSALSDDELSIVQEQAFLVNQEIRYPKCVVDEYLNVHATFERGQYGCNHPKAVQYKKMNGAPLLRIECPDYSVLFVEMTGSGTEWEGTFTPPAAGTYMVRVSGSDSAGNTGVGHYEFEYDASAVAGRQGLPSRAALGGNCPNPFVSRTSIAYAIGRNGNVSMEIYNVRGERIKMLADERQAAGSYHAVWDGTDEEGHRVASGIYFCRLKAGADISTSKMILAQ